MKYVVFLHPKANDFLGEVDETLEIRIRNKLKALISNPEKGRRLKHSDFWRLRIGDYRAIYEIDYPEERIIVLFIGHRKNIYDDFSKLI